MTTTARPHSTKTPLNPGESRPHKAGNAVITIARGVDCYSITVQQGVEPVENWCGTYATEREMRAAYHHTYRAFHAHGTAQGIEARRNQLACELNGQHARARRRMHNPGRIDTIETELAALEDLHTRNLTVRLRADMNTFLAA
jgi:hypothetical protein